MKKKNNYYMWLMRKKIKQWRENIEEYWSASDVCNASDESTAKDPKFIYHWKGDFWPGYPFLPGMHQKREPCQIQVGLITFDMSLNMPYSNIMLHVTELTELIAHDLEVDTNQVKLLNSSREGNSSLLRWAIFPARSSSYMSNTTATGIIARLTEHRVNLPKTFGSYQLREWKVEPPSRRTWWQKNYWVVLIGVSVATVISIASVFGWYIWKKRSTGAGTYLPVDVAVPEQELQPM